MKPLRITAVISDAISLTYGTLALDGLLGALYCVVHRLPKPALGVEPAPLPLPLAMEPGGRFYLASSSDAVFDQHDSTHFHKQFPHQIAKHHSKIKRITVATGINKSWRMPLPMAYPTEQKIAWWCIGDRDAIEDLLQYCHHLGKKRGDGFGRVLRWSVEDCEPWGDGFPIVRNGKPMRPLPYNWPGVVEPDVRMCRLTHPYWLNIGQQPCAVPEEQC